ncbi:MAG: glycosyltransferase family 1 protein [Candidatus Riflebacteria bacterium]
MKILFDFQIFCLQKFGGISRYYCELFQKISELNHQVKIFSPFHINDYLTEYGINSSSLFKSRVSGKKIFFLRKLNELLTNFFLINHQPEIIHETYFKESPYLFSGSKSITTVYDMIFELFYDQNLKDIESRKKKATVERVQKIICISESTRNDLVKVYGISKEKTEVVYLATSMKKSECSITDALRKPYILFVGNRQNYKNFSLFFEAFSNSEKTNRSFDLVCCGGGDFSREELLMFQKCKTLEKVLYFPGTEENLARLYSNARAFVFPSRYEGFGIPILEAMSCECPVICSNTSSFPEVAGKAAEFFDPTSQDDIRFKLEQILFDDTKISQLRMAGTEQNAKFSWDLCAKQTLDIYSTLLR